jgi:hypothetical protein
MAVRQTKLTGIANTTGPDRKRSSDAQRKRSATSSDGIPLSSFTRDRAMLQARADVTATITREL